MEKPDEAHAAPGGSGWQSQLTVRALAVGLVIGALLSFTNMYFGLMTAWITMGSIQVCRDRLSLL